jgi:TolB protein
MMLKILTMSFFLLVHGVYAQSQSVVVAVGKAELEKQVMAVTFDGKKYGTQKDKLGLINQATDIIRNDFSFYRKRFAVNKVAKAKMSKSSFSKSGASYAINLDLLGSAGSYILEAKLYTKNGEEGLQSSSFKKSDLRLETHRLADRVFRKITGKGSIFMSHILFVSDKDGSRRKPVKELYIMDFDGGNPKRLTRHYGTVISPSISMNGSQVMYSLIKNSKAKNRNVNLYILDLKSGKNRVLSSRKGINSGAVFMPDGKSILTTMSHQGNAELYAMNIKSGALKRITKHYAPDVDPSINVQGNLVAFLSGRSGAGRPMIYVADPRAQEKNIKRVSFVGKFNATPRFSPDGSEIVFSSWLDNRFDIFRVDSTGANLHRLTRDFGSNEDPTYSNDGEFIAFSSQRVISMKKAVQNIYIMDRDGEILGPVTSSFGKCSSPRWSK